MTAVKKEKENGKIVESLSRSVLKVTGPKWEKCRTFEKLLQYFMDVIRL